jgi:hypothetical protein
LGNEQERIDISCGVLAHGDRSSAHVDPEYPLVSSGDHERSAIGTERPGCGLCSDVDLLDQLIGFHIEEIHRRPGATTRDGAAIRRQLEPLCLVAWR